MTTVRLFGRNWPCSGGGYFRLLPYALFRRGAVAGCNRGEGQPGIFYFHPWEIDPGQPRVAGAGWKSRVRHYTEPGADGRGSWTACLPISRGTGWTGCLRRNC